MTLYGKTFGKSISTKMYGTTFRAIPVYYFGYLQGYKVIAKGHKYPTERGKVYSDFTEDSIPWSAIRAAEDEYEGIRLATIRGRI